MRKAIVTGSAGFIGASFVQFLVSKGVDVIALGRKALIDVPEKRQKKIEGATYISLDMKDIKDLSHKIDEIKWSAGEDCIFFNLAWGGESGLSDLNIEAQMKNVAWCVNAL